jgi:hypothetical protein
MMITAILYYSFKPKESSVLTKQQRSEEWEEIL